jgi:hypothetical protein
MIRPMIYQCVTKISIALVLTLLWNQFINKDALFSMIRDAFFVVGILFFMLAWFQYLRLDGVRIHHLLEGHERPKKKKRHKIMDIVDFADEKIISFDELDEDEKNVCRLLGDLICGIIFTVLALVALICYI